MTLDNFIPTNNRLLVKKTPAPPVKPGALIFEAVSRVHIEATVIRKSEDYIGNVKSGDTIYFNQYAGLSLDCFQDHDVILVKGEEVLGFISNG